MSFLSSNQQCQSTEGKYHIVWTCIPLTALPCHISFRHLLIFYLSDTFSTLSRCWKRSSYSVTQTAHWMQESTILKGISVKTCELKTLHNRDISQHRSGHLVECDGYPYKSTLHDSHFKRLDPGMRVVLFTRPNCLRLIPRLRRSSTCTRWDGNKDPWFQDQDPWFQDQDAWFQDRDQDPWFQDQDPWFQDRDFHRSRHWARGLRWHSA